MRTVRQVLVTAAVTLLAAGTAALVPAQAAAAPLSADGAADLVRSLGADRTAGSYLDASGRMVVNVTDAATAASVRAAGGVARVVSRSSQQLDAVMARLDAGVAGTAWAVDAASNQVVISVDSSVSGASLAALKSAAAGPGRAARVQRSRRSPGRRMPWRSPRRSGRDRRAPGPAARCPSSCRGARTESARSESIGPPPP